MEGVAAAINMENATVLARDVLPTPEYSQMAKPIATPATLPKNVAVEQIEGQQIKSQLQQLLRINTGQNSPASTGVTKEYGKFFRSNNVQEEVETKTTNATMYGGSYVGSARLNAATARKQIGVTDADTRTVTLVELADGATDMGATVEETHSTSALQI